ncbi:MAG: DUF3086 domain-containing protein [Tildeniella nuda ZEHNDER 1965/U140]|jgi:hypothetical protein|nr:DUF3086 domain-containing protein [Tildeniella nuda ZEHNDER 1965/U140]
MNSDELPIAAAADTRQSESTADEPEREAVTDLTATEPLGIQEASAQALIEEERIPLLERVETEQALPSIVTGTSATVTEVGQRVADLQRREQTLRREIAALQASQARLQEETAAAQAAMGRLVQEGLKELEQRKQSLQISVEQLERRQERIRSEMRTTFSGVSQDLAIRVQSFKDYLVGSLQDLALAAEQLDLPQPGKAMAQSIDRTTPKEDRTSQSATTPQFAEQSFQEQTKKIRNLLDQYRNRPDYYGSAWQLRRTFEPIHAERVSNWFFTQGGRGAVRTMGSRLQNILIASATISILHTLYGDRLRALVLAQSPERLGEWRRGLQDCLGITRSEFGPERGVGLFEDPMPLAQKADRLMKDGLMPLIIIDETEEDISLSLLQFSLWLAFAPNPQAATYSY